jgi:hypothetical protein
MPVSWMTAFVSPNGEAAIVSDVARSWGCLCGTIAQSIAAAMIEIGLLVDRQQLDRCCPKPGGRVQLARAVFLLLAKPFPA